MKKTALRSSMTPPSHITCFQKRPKSGRAQSSRMVLIAPSASARASTERLMRSGAEDGTTGRAVAARDAQRQAIQLVDAGRDAPEVEPFEDDDARAEQRAMHRMPFGAERLDREVVDADQLHAALHQELRAFERQRGIVARERPAIPQRGVARLQEHARVR